MKSLLNEINLDWAPKKLKKGQKTNLTITLTIPKDIHIQAHKPAEELLIPTKIELEKKVGLSFGQPIYPKPKELPTSWSEVKLLVYEGKINILIPLEISKDAKSGEYLVKGNLSYQGCTAKLCLPPKSKQFTLALLIS
ncbi:hypothetical protein HYS97_03125 [Candidatus Daviesbacteria bacterium]|nr:hypothetical protein [Candidatus Daviesbacteria bacterium]